MNFYNYMKKYRDEDSNRGDLANDMHRDKSFPKNGIGKFNAWKRIIFEYLENKGACEECLETFEEVWIEYENYERGRLKRPLIANGRKIH